MHIQVEVKENILILFINKNRQKTYPETKYCDFIKV